MPIARPLALAISLLLPCALAGAAPPLEPEVAEVRQLLRENRIGLAVELGESVVEALPTSGNAWMLLGDAYGRQAMRVDARAKTGWTLKSRDAYEKAVELAPGNPDARFSLMQYYTQAPQYLGGGREKALLQAAGLAAIGAAWGHMGRAALLLADGKADAAIAAYQAAVTAEPGNPRATLGLISLNFSEKHYADARAAIEAALSRDPQDPVALFMLGRIAVEDGVRIEDAIEGIDTFVSLDARPEQLSLASAWWSKGRLLEKAGRRDAAIEALEQAVSLDAGLERAQNDLKRLRG
jgi:tetratricopeptide (TPR) repeat protein